MLTFVALAGWMQTALAEPTALEIVERADAVLWGTHTAKGDFEMTIVTPSWTRTRALKAWMLRPKKSFIRITSPAKEEGVGSLRIDAEMWNYLPQIERTVKIPPSLLLQPWLSSDFTNDDLMKQNSLITDYTHRITAEQMVDGVSVYALELKPKPEAAVAWGKIEYWIRKEDFVPLKRADYDERGDLVRQLVFSDVRKFGKHVLPSRWEMRPANKPGKYTTVIVHSMVFDEPIGDEVFSLRNLRSKN